MSLRKYCAACDPAVKNPKWLFCPWCGIELFPDRKKWKNIP